jgi:hypothetical protein
LCFFVKPTAREGKAAHSCGVRDLKFWDRDGAAAAVRGMPSSASVALVLALALSLCGAAEPVARRRPSLSSATAATSSKAANEESLGSQLLSAVLLDDLAAAAAIFAGVSASQAVRLANAIDWRGKSVLMHASCVARSSAPPNFLSRAR